jgi:hypothetical protein
VVAAAVTDEVASLTSAADTMVRALAFSLPIGALSAVAFGKSTVPKFDRCSTLPSLGASAITSADPSWGVIRIDFLPPGASRIPRLASCACRAKRLAAGRSRAVP